MIKKGGVNKELKSLTVKNTQLLLVVLSNWRLAHAWYRQSQLLSPNIEERERGACFCLNIPVKEWTWNPFLFQLLTGMP
jgi:hypothetical protein